MAHQKITPDFPTAELVQIGAVKAIKPSSSAWKSSVRPSVFNGSSDKWAHFTPLTPKARSTLSE
ncbi:MAG: hypothetical protein WB689_36175 [Xanthobacteraceae bacterium]